jgi:mRNA-degrading endonuclease RelE of RelBE toxin-antitoxin system
MPIYQIELTEDATSDLAWYRAFERKIILSQIRQELEQEPLTETRNRKRLRDNPIAPWELRIGKYRVFYYVPEETTVVSVVAIGHKEHNLLFIRGQEVSL